MEGTEGTISITSHTWLCRSWGQQLLLLPQNACVQPGNEPLSIIQMCQRIFIFLFNPWSVLELMTVVGCSPLRLPLITTWVSSPSIQPPGQSAVCTALPGLMQFDTSVGFFLHLFLYFHCVAQMHTNISEASPLPISSSSWLLLEVRQSHLYHCEFYQLEIQTIIKKWFQAARWPLSASVKCCIYALNF